MQRTEGPAPTGLRGLWIAAFGFGAVSNLLLLTGPIFMLQVYDRVLPGRSVETLLALVALMAFLYAVMAVIDTARGRLIARIGARFRLRMEGALLAGGLRARTRDPPTAPVSQAVNDLDSVQRVLTSGAAQAAMDLPWTALFLALLALVHPLLGWLALMGGAVLVLTALASFLAQRHPRNQAMRQDAVAARLLAAVEGPGVDGLPPLRAGIGESWQALRWQGLATQLLASDRAVAGMAAARAFRLFLQSATLALGAWLVIRHDMSAGLMIGASILLGRALAPVELLAGQWGALVSAWAAWRRLAARAQDATGTVPAPVSTAQGPLVVRGLMVAGPRGVLLRLGGFEVAPGRALGVIGPGGSGKSLLARVLSGGIPATAGQVSLGPVPVAFWPPGAVGYLPQRLVLPPGTLTQAISGYDPRARDGTVQAAANAAGAHAAILALPDGYVSRADDPTLPAGLVQRIGLAGAIHGDPPLVVMDEPNTHLDAEGAAALNATIRALKARGAVVVVTANRPAAIAECEDLLVLDKGAQAAFGPRDQVLREMVRTRVALVDAVSGSGVTP
ncbi:MAG: ATP-binding cassette domain-containing protein [Rhodobacteraceae bacterium]|nr:ATP-binding cassette domain-containing protein [Paracoccaceae bacterium]